MSAGFIVDRRKLTGRKSKYNAKPTVVDGIRFASQKEARRYASLKLELQAGKIKNLTLQPSFSIYAPDLAGGANIKVGTYKADFAYRRGREKVVEDVKGHKTDVYKLKKKLVEATYGITIVET